MIRASIAYAESAEKALSILEYRPDLGADYLALADEVLARIGRVGRSWRTGTDAPTLTAGMGIRVFHCDDSEAFTRLVAFWLAEHDDIEHAGQAHTRRGGAAPRCRTRSADVVLLDTLGKPGDDTLLKQIRAVAPEAKVIVYSGYVRLMQEGALGVGADAYLEKGDDDGPLIEAIRSVVA